MFSYTVTRKRHLLQYVSHVSLSAKFSYSLITFGHTLCKNMILCCILCGLNWAEISQTLFDQGTNWGNNWFCAAKTAWRVLRVELNHHQPPSIPSSWSSFCQISSFWWSSSSSLSWWSWWPETSTERWAGCWLFRSFIIIAITISYQCHQSHLVVTIIFTVQWRPVTSTEWPESELLSKIILPSSLARAALVNAIT